jgi:hypothetical protein
MGFLDNLENSLKSLESREERDPNEQKRRDANRARELAAAPWAEQLKNSPFTQQLYHEATVTGHRLRTKIYMSWLGDSLRLQARDRQLALRPTPQGIVAEFFEPDGSSALEDLNLEGSPLALLQRWLGTPE